MNNFYENYEEDLIIEKIHALGEGKHLVFKFSNGFGASMVKTPYSYSGRNGLWEIAVVTFDGVSDKNFTITYDTPITDDVLGSLTEQEAVDTLEQIKALSKGE